jgi:hypothetical protein
MTPQGRRPNGNADVVSNGGTVGVGDVGGLRCRRQRVHDEGRGEMTDLEVRLTAGGDVLPDRSQVGVLLQPPLGDGYRGGVPAVRVLEAPFEGMRENGQGPCRVGRGGQ